MYDTIFRLHRLDLDILVASLFSLHNAIYATIKPTHYRLRIDAVSLPARIVKLQPFLDGPVDSFFWGGMSILRPCRAGMVTETTVGLIGGGKAVAI
jgi:hypothetical protein